mmetsp:Transcript_90553/g.234809  ORF Transcript_90553/g.234809 Transcript_90553/m.234809 type:complete len:270 (-) Transcript_90553:764-1573(-)
MDPACAVHLSKASALPQRSESCTRHAEQRAKLVQLARSCIWRGSQNYLTSASGSQLCPHRFAYHLLSDGQICHDFLAASQDGRVLVCLLEALHTRAHACPGDASATEHLHRLVSDQSTSPSGLILQQGDGPTELLGLLFVRHLVHLVSYNLEQGMCTFNCASHSGQLLAQHRLLDQWLAESHALRGPLEAVRDLHPATHEELGNDEPSFMVEVVHDASEALALLALVAHAHQIFHWHHHIVEDDERRASAARVRSLDGLGLHAHIPRNE